MRLRNDIQVDEEEEEEDGWIVDYCQQSSNTELATVAVS